VKSVEPFAGVCAKDTSPKAAIKALNAIIRKMFFIMVFTGLS
jgi:hypothetical protein